MNIKNEEQKLFFDKIKIDNEIKSNMLNNSYYLDWVVRFMNIYPYGFSDYDVCEDEFDNQNIQKIHLFYELIESYAMHNYVKDFINNHTFIIKYGDYFFEISKKYCGGNYKYTILKLSGDNVFKFIDFNDVKENKHNENFDIANKIIQELACKIDELYQSGVPISYIKEITDKVINDIVGKKEPVLVYKKGKR